MMQQQHRAFYYNGLVLGVCNPLIIHIWGGAKINTDYYIISFISTGPSSSFHSPSSSPFSSSSFHSPYPSPLSSSSFHSPYPSPLSSSFFHSPYPSSPSPLSSSMPEILCLYSVQEREKTVVQERHATSLIYSFGEERNLGAQQLPRKETNFYDNKISILIIIMMHNLL